MGYLLDNPATNLGIAEANFNMAHRHLLAIENALKMGRPFEDVQYHYRLLISNVQDLPANYRDSVSDPWDGAENRIPAFVETEGG